VKGDAVTILDAQSFVGSISSRSAGMVQSIKIWAPVLVFGAYLPANPHFERMYFRVPGLQVWLGRGYVNIEKAHDKNKNITKTSFCIEQVPDEQFSIESIDSDISLRCERISRLTSCQLLLKAYGWFSFQPRQKKPIDWFWRHHNTFIMMLSFLSADVFFADAIQAEVDDSNDRLDILVTSPESKNNKDKTTMDFLLSRSRISTELCSYCNKWFAIFDRVEKPACLAQGIFASKSPWLYVEFLLLMQALEGLHRALYDDNYMSDPEYEKVEAELVHAIPDNVQSNHKDALKSRIRYGNQFSLRKRLDELAGKLSKRSCACIFGGSGYVPQSWIDTRNYYTHWDSDLLSKALDNQDMYHANIKMQYFIRSIYIQLMGISSEDLDAAFHGNTHAAYDLRKII